MECPEGYVFGKDWDENTECAVCQTDIWDECGARWDELTDLQYAKRKEILNRNFKGIV